MNAGDAYPLFAALLTLKPWDELTELTPDRLALEGSRDEKNMIQEYAQVGLQMLRGGMQGTRG